MASRRFRSCMGLLALFVSGCAGAATPAEAPTGGMEASRSPAIMPPASRSSSDFSIGGMGGRGGMDKSRPADPDGQVQIVEVMGGGAPESADPPKSDPTPRKILYTADIDLVVEDFTKLEAAILKLVRQNGGYLADTDVSGSTGSNRTARWKIRIPIEKFDGFLEETARLGELTRRQLHSQDVTEEFYDLEARIKNKKIEEARLLKHLQDSTGKLQDILAAERELSRVREEVERQEGRVRLLANLAALTTITIAAVERTNYVPATAPSFGTRAARQLADSTKGLVDTAEGVAIWGIGILPWIPFYLIAGIFTFIGLRRLGRRAVDYLNRPRPAAS